MTKLLLVEDDNSLREIYATRMKAEGYEIVTASDGEEALAVAMKERPDLIVLDVMMPKISGFDVLDILRSTPEIKNTKIMIMTALSQESDRARGESLGADKYVVKSQVTLEDVVNNVKELLAAPARHDPEEVAPSGINSEIHVPNLPIQDAGNSPVPAPSPIPTAEPAVMSEPVVTQPQPETETQPASGNTTQPPVSAQ